MTRARNLANLGNKNAITADIGLFNIGIGSTQPTSYKLEVVGGDAYIGGGVTITGNLSVGGTVTYEDVTNVDAVGIITAQSGVNIVGGGLTCVGVATFFSASIFKDDVTFTGTAANATWDSSASSLIFNDNAKAIFGTSSDGLEIYHQGSYSAIVDSGTGSLILGSNVFEIKNAALSETQAVFTQDAGVDLYYNNSTKFSTNNDGVVITGIATATTFVGGLTGTSGSFSSSLDIADKIRHTGDTDTAIRFPSADTITAETGGTERLRIDSSGTTTIAGELDLTGKCLTSFGGNSTNEAACIKVGYEGSSKGQVRVYGADNSTTGSLEFKVCEGDGTDDHTMLFDGAGRLLIGTTTEGHAAADEFTISNTTSAADMGMTLRSATNGQGAIYFSDGTSGDAEYRGIINYNHTSDFLNIYTAAAEALRIENNGQVNFKCSDMSNPDIGGGIAGVAINKAGNTGQIYACVDDDAGLYYKNWTMNLCRRNNAGDGPQLALDRGGWVKASIAGLQGSNTATSAAGQFAIYTHAFDSGSHVQSERLRIASNGNVGIATNSPYGLLTIMGNAEGGGANMADHGILLHAPGATHGHIMPITCSFENSGMRPRCGIGFISKPTADPVEGYAGEIGFYTRSAADGSGLDEGDEKIRITKVGRVGLGITNPTRMLHLHESSAGEAMIHFSTPTTGTTSSDGFRVGVNGSEESIVWNNENTVIKFGTNNSERMRLAGDGAWMVATTSDSPDASTGTGMAYASSKLRVSRSGDPAGAFNRANTTGDIIQLNYNGTQRGSIQTDGTVIAFNTGSDYRLKENEVALTDGITKVKQLKPYTFNFKDSPNKIDQGFFAHEVQPVVPGAVSGTKDAVHSEDKDSEGIKAGDIDAQQMDYAKLTPLLTAALQEAIAKIETLEAKVAALES